MAITVNVTHTAMATKCPACLDHLASGPAVTKCTVCQAYHHAPCLEELGCASLVCTATGAEGYTRGAVPLTGDLSEHPNPLARAIAEGGYHSSSYNETHQEWQLPCVSNSSYGAGLLERANYATLAAEFGGDPCHCDLTGEECDGHPCDEIPVACSFWNDGSFQVLQTPCQCPRGAEDPWSCEQAALEIMDSLEDYPILDDSLHSEAECHDEQEQWDDWGRSDFVRDLEKATELEWNGTDDQADELRWEAQDETQEYPERGSDVSFPIDSWVAYLTGNVTVKVYENGYSTYSVNRPADKVEPTEDHLDYLTRFGFDYPEPLPYDHPLQPEQILSLGNIISATSAVEILPPGRPDTPDTRRMIARTVYSKVSRYATRKRYRYTHWHSTGRYYRRLCYRVALEYYLAKG